MGTTTHQSRQQAVLICDESPSQHTLTRHSLEVRNLSKSKETLNESSKFIKSNKGMLPHTPSDLMAPYKVMERSRMSQDSIVLPGYLRTIGTGSSHDCF